MVPGYSPQGDIMVITILATLCHLATASAPGIAGHEDTTTGLDIHPRKFIVEASQLNLCHEETVFEGEGSMQMCLLPQAAIAQWKAQSAYADDEWHIQKIRCLPGHNPKRNAI